MNREDVAVAIQSPSPVYTEAEGDERTQFYTDIQLYMQNMEARFITGRSDIEADWDACIAQPQAMGLDRLLESEQAAYTRLMGA